MNELLGAIRSHSGIVIISDSNSDPTQKTAIFQINDTSVAAVFRGKDAVKDFLDKHILPKKPQTIQETLDVINTKLNEHVNEYASSDFSFFVASYEHGEAIYFGFWFIDGKIKTSLVTTLSHFIATVEDLAVYITTKVYSEHMTLEELKNLMAFVTLQCIKVFGMNSLIDVTTISKEGVKKLSEGEIQERLSSQDRVDHKLKKIFSDFFIKEGISK